MRTDGLLINGYNALTTYGVMMDEGFLDALNAPAPLKEFLSFESRVTDGTEYLLMDASQHSMAKTKARELTLKFRVWADESGTLTQQQTQLQQRKDAFLTVLQVGAVAIKVPDVSDKTYNLVYTGQNIAFNYNALRTSCSIAAKFVEALYAQPPVPVPPAPTPIPVYPLEVENAPIVIDADTTWSATYRVKNAEGTVTVTSSSPNITAEITTIDSNPYLRVRTTSVLQADLSATVTVVNGTASVSIPVTAIVPTLTLSVDAPIKIVADAQAVLFPILNASGTVTVSSSSVDIVASVVTQNNSPYLSVRSATQASTTVTAVLTLTDSEGTITVDAIAEPVIEPKFVVTPSNVLLYNTSDSIPLEFTLDGEAPYTLDSLEYNYGQASSANQKAVIDNYAANIASSIQIVGNTLEATAPKTTSMLLSFEPIFKITIVDNNGLYQDIILVIVPWRQWETLA
ncbi:MAG: hypothetical protein J6T22_09115 [Bacteroidales bacterium]|nr:hypothetical protein [Bacteroidales bacterium]